MASTNDIRASDEHNNQILHGRGKGMTTATELETETETVEVVTVIAGQQR
jgi:hypothetical protein